MLDGMPKGFSNINILMVFTHKGPRDIGGMDYLWNKGINDDVINVNTSPVLLRFKTRPSLATWIKKTL